MPLCDLREHISVQNERIRNLPRGAITPSTNWKAFRGYFWGKSLASLEHEELVEPDPDPNPDFRTPQKRKVSIIPHRLLQAWNLEIPAGKFLVRSDYAEAEQEALEQFRDVGVAVFMVTGTAGIGLSPSPFATY